jgi:hypothetical protein
MEYSRPIISICIPTNGATKWVIPTLKGLYSQGVDLSLFDVVITDNGENSNLKDELKQFDYSNLFYYKTDDKGFLNLITSLKLGNGIYHKMLNHRSILEPNALKNWISLIEKYKLTKPVIYCSNGSIINDEITECKNLDEFVRNLHYMCTWSGGIGIWDEDIESLNEIKYNEMFPNTSLLFEHRQHSDYIIYNKIFEVQQDGQGKGCYNLFNTFAVVFPSMLKDLLCRGRITSRTYDKVLKDLYRCLQDFYMQFVLRSQDKSFDLTGIHKSLTTYYSEKDYLRMMYYCHKIYYCEKIKDILTCAKRKILGWKQNN